MNEKKKTQVSDQPAAGNNVMAENVTLEKKPSGSLSVVKGWAARTNRTAKGCKAPQNTNASTAKPVLAREPVPQSKGDPSKVHLKWINRDPLTIDTDKSIGSGTFGKCYNGLYRDAFRVVVKEIKTHDSTKELERVRGKS